MLSKRHKYEIVIFMTLTLFRSIPEILTYPYPVGYDSPFYVGLVKRFGSLDFISYMHNIIFFEYKQPPFLYLIYYLEFHVLGDAILAIKLTTPILYGFLGIAVFLFYKEIVVRDNVEAFYAAIATGFYYTILSLSNGIFKNLLAIDLFMLALYFRGKSKQTTKDLILFSLFALLTVLSHQLVALLLALTTTFFLFFDQKNKPLFKRFIADIFVVCLGFLSTIFFTSNLLESIISVHPSVPQFSQFSNYTFQTIAISVIGTFLTQEIAVLSLFLIVVRRVGFKAVGKELLKYKIILFWFLITMFFGFLPIFIYPYKVSFWHRWLLMLSFPFIFMVIRLLVVSKHVILKPISMSRPVKIAIVFVSVVSFGHIVFPTPPPYSYYVVPTPTTMIMNSVPTSQMRDLEVAFNKVNLLMNSDQAFIAPEPLYGWALYYLDNNKTVYLAFWNVSESLERGIKEGYKQFYLIWWKQSIYVVVENGTKIRDRLIIPDSFQIIGETEYFYIYFLDITASHMKFPMYYYTYGFNEGKYQQIYY